MTDVHRFRAARAADQATERPPLLFSIERANGDVETFTIPAMLPAATFGELSAIEQDQPGSIEHLNALTRFLAAVFRSDWPRLRDLSTVDEWEIPQMSQIASELVVALLAVPSTPPADSPEPLSDSGTKSTGGSSSRARKTG